MDGIVEIEGTAEQLCKEAAEEAPLVEVLEVKAAVQVLWESCTAPQKHPKSPVVVAVSKFQSIDKLRAAYSDGQRVFGENYVQELQEKAGLLPADVRWHFIGHLQSNKCRALLAVPNLVRIETLDRIKLAHTLDRCCQDFNRTAEVMIQVNTSGEDSKSGVINSQSDVLELARVVIEDCPRLQLSGLMTVAHPEGERATICFSRLQELKSVIQSQLLSSSSSAREIILAGTTRTDTIPSTTVLRPLDLSMGMSTDYHLAIPQGASHVRIGSSIFGRRVKPCTTN